MFNQNLYPIMGPQGISGDSQPVQSYTGKEVSLKRFLNQGKETREEILKKMQPIVGDIFRLWDTIEREFPEMVQKSKHYYGSKKYSKYNKGEVVGREFVSTEEAEEPFGVGYTLTEDGGKYGFTAYVDFEGDKISVNGNAKEKSGKLTGEGAIADNGEDVFNFSFKDIECDDEFVKGSVTLGLSAFELDDMTLNFDAKDGKQTFDTEFTYKGTKLFDVAVEASNETPESITVFNESAKVYNLTEDGAEMEQYLAEINIEEFATGFLKAFGLKHTLTSLFRALNRALQAA